jgi:hypothetical protein
MAEESCSLQATRKQRGVIGRGQCQHIPFKGMPKQPRFSNWTLPTHTEFHHLPIVYSDFESTNGLNHLLGQSLQDPVEDL